MTKVFGAKGKTLKGMLIAASLLSSLTIFSAAQQAQAQYIGANSKESVKSSSPTEGVTAAESDKAPAAESDKASAAESDKAPVQKGAVNGTVGPQGADATVIAGVNTAGTVRVDNLAMLEAVLNIGANGTEIIGIVWGGCLLFAAFTKTPKDKRTRLALLSLALIMSALATPAAMHWLLAGARDANLFS